VEYLHGRYVRAHRFHWMYGRQVAVDVIGPYATVSVQNLLLIPSTRKSRLYIHGRIRKCYRLRLIDTTSDTTQGATPSNGGQPSANKSA
jgi:hypothetical protein